MGSATEIKWHTKPISKVLEILKSSEHGLSSIEAKRRLEEGGLNVLPESRPDSAIFIFLRQFQSPLIYILLAAALAVFFIGEKTDGIVIMTVLILNAVVGSIQEGRARNTLLALKQYVETKAVVLRDDKEIIVADSQVVVGDIILLQGGEKIAADARIISAQNLKIDEASLTGESEAVHKTSSTLDNPNLPAQEERNMLFKGTHVVAGNGKAIVVRTGVETIIGQIAKEVSSIETEIPLKTNIRNLSKVIIMITVGVNALLFVIGIVSGKFIMQMLIFVISISVSIIPEGLPVAITVKLHLSMFVASSAVCYTGNMAKDWTEIQKKYKGQWVALADDEEKVLGTGKTAREALEQAQKKGYEYPILTRMPEEIVTYIGGFDLHASA